MKRKVVVAVLYGMCMRVMGEGVGRKKQEKRAKIGKKPGKGKKIKKNIKI